MIPVVFPSTPIPKIYGIKNDEWWDMYTGNNDGGTAISEAYYKCGPDYANGNSAFTPARIWVKTGNESLQSHLALNYYNDYGTVKSMVMNLRNTSYANDVPVLRKVETNGTAISSEINLYQDISATTVNVNSNSGQAVLSVANVGSFAAGMQVIVNQGGAREEILTISSVETASITLTTNLTYTHTAEQADAVTTYGESFKVYSVDLDIEPKSPEDQDWMR
jgi:hypothetical protein